MDTTFSRSMITRMYFLLLFLAAGCTPLSSDYQPVPVEDALNKGRLSFFLNLQETDGPDLSMQIEQIQFVAENGSLSTHDFPSLVVESAKIGDGQKFVTRIALEPGKYTRMKVKIGEAGEVREGNTQLLPFATSEFAVDLHTPLDISVGDSRSFFLTWDTKKSLQNNKFTPSLELAPQVKKLIADVGYVACPDIDTVFMFSTKENRVIDSLGLAGGPSYLFQAHETRADEVYVLGGKSLRLYGFSPASNGITAQYTLSTMSMPVHMALHPNGRTAYVIDSQLGTVSRLDLTSGSIDRQTRLNFDPRYIVYLDKYKLLAVSLALSQNVLLLDPQTLEQQDSISTGSRPEGFELVDDRYLYIVEGGANSIMIYDLDSRQTVKRIPVGFQPSRVFSTSNFIYVLNRGDNTISALRHGLTTIPRDIFVDGRPLEMAFSADNNQLYVGNRDKMALEIMNPITNALTGSIELGAVPQGILVLH